MSHTLFAGHHRVTSGSLATVALALKTHPRTDPAVALLVFDDQTGKQVDLDVSGSANEVRARYTPVPADDAAPRGPGRPRLGVVPREVTLLPHHWDWLNAQPGGASVTLRKLVEQARKAGAADERVRLAREATYRFLHAVGGDLPAFEEVTRALFAGDHERMEALMDTWPDDVRDYARRLIAPAAPSP